MILTLEQVVGGLLLAAALGFLLGAYTTGGMKR